LFGWLFCIWLVILCFAIFQQLWRTTIYKFDGSASNHLNTKEIAAEIYHHKWSKIDAQLWVFILYQTN